jgi:hypothetical protein
MQLRLTTACCVVLVMALLAVAPAAAETVRSGDIQMDTSEITQTSGTTTPSQSLVEYLGNPGFETGALPPWTTNNWTVTNADAHSGTFSAFDAGNFWIRQDFPPIDTANVNSVRFWMRQPEAQISAYDFFYDDNSFDEDIVFVGANWQQFDVTAGLRPSGNILVAIRIYGYSGGPGGPDETYLDDVSLDVTGATAVEAGTWGEIKAIFQ